MSLMVSWPLLPLPFACVDPEKGTYGNMGGFKLAEALGYLIAAETGWKLAWLNP